MTGTRRDLNVLPREIIPTDFAPNHNRTGRLAA